MAMELYQNHMDAYCAAVKKIKSCKKAAVAHPAGTGKIELIRKLIEDHPGELILWLVPDLYRLGLRQYETKNGLPDHVKLFTGGQLAEAEPEQWVRLGEMHPAYLVLDSYQEISAELWNQSVARLLSLCPEILLLGLTEMDVPDCPCRSAQDLFRDAVVSQYGIGEAVAAGALMPPCPFVSLLWSGRDVMAGLKARTRNLRSPGQPDPNQQLYNNLSYAVWDADREAMKLLNAMAASAGRYYVLAESVEWAEECLPQVEELLTCDGRKPKTYCVGDRPLISSPALEAFRKDETPCVRLLVYQNRPDAQLRLEGLDGILLLRKSADPEVFRQMFSRAMAAGGREMQMVDFAGSFEGVMAMLSVRREYENAARNRGGVPVEFRQQDILRQSTLCFRKLKKGLESRWDAYYTAAKACCRDPQGKLEIPRSYVSKDGLAVGRWLEIQRQVRAGQRPGRLTEEQIARLDKLGIVWKQRLALAWEKGYASAQKYRDTHGNLLVPVRYRDRNGFALGEWIVYNRQRYLSGNLDPHRVERLQALGMVWDTMGELWEQSYAAAARYYLEHGDLEVPVKYVMPDGFALGVWLGSQRAAYKNGDLTDEQIARLNAIGADWSNRNDRKWQQAYAAAVRYYKEHGNLEVPSEYVNEEGLLLGKWIARQRYAYLNPDRSSARLTPERKALLDKLGMTWSHGNSWDQRMELARKYKAEHGGSSIPSQYKTETGIWLGSWISRQKQRLKKNDPTLTPEQSKALKELLENELERVPRVSKPRGQIRGQNWMRNYRRAKAYYKKHGDLLVPAGYADETGFRLGVWISNLRAARKNRPGSFQVTPEHIEMLNEIGMEWDAREAQWCSAFRMAEQFHIEKGCLLVPVNYKTPDRFCLGDWVRRMRECYAAKDPKLTQDKIEKLDALGMVWDQDLRKTRN